MGEGDEMTKYPVEIGVVYEGERIRKNEMQVEFGGEKVQNKAELCEVKPVGELTDGKVTIIGPDLDKLKPDSSNDFFIHLKVGGKGAEPQLEGVFERRIHDIFNYIQGVMHLNQRDYVWIRVSKESYKKGLRLKHIGSILAEYIKKEFSIIEKAEVELVTDPKEAKKRLEHALKKYDERNARVAGMKDEEVDTFYSCDLCKSFASKHICVISPNRPASCGAINWLDARAAEQMNPEGPNQAIPKGKLVDADRGEWEGVNKFMDEYTGGSTKRVNLYSMFGYPHTSCGCFEAVCFYIPDLDGIGIVHRGFQGEAVNGLSFAEMASQTGGGEQIIGFLGIGLENLRSPRFLSYDGGFKRVVWMPKSIKEKYIDVIPAEMREKIATEENAKNTKELKEFLEKVGHPVLRKEEVKEEKKEEKPGEVEVSAVALEGVPGMGGVTIKFKNVRIIAERMVLEKEK
jgi:acetyl-CoA decarbonylase/synthase complex subunit beta